MDIVQAAMYGVEEKDQPEILQRLFGWAQNKESSDDEQGKRD